MKQKKRFAPLFLPSKSLVVPEKVFHTVVESSDEPGVVNTVTSGAHERLELRSEIFGDTHLAVVVLDDTIHIFGNKRAVFFLESEKINVRLGNHIDYGTISVTLVFFAGRGGSLFARLPRDELGAAVFPFKGIKIS